MTELAGSLETMNFVFCGCKIDCGNLFGCKPHGLPCNIACSVCMGTNYTNIYAQSSTNNIVDPEDENISEIDCEFISKFLFHSIFNAPEIRYQ